MVDVDWQLSRQFLLLSKSPSTEDFGVNMEAIITLLSERGIRVEPWDLELQHERATLDIGEFLDRGSKEPEAPPCGVDLTDVAYWAELCKERD